MKVWTRNKKPRTLLAVIVESVFDDVFKYTNLNNAINRERAIELVREMEGYRVFTIELICITKERADFLLQKANSILKELENLKGRDNKEKVPFYNWLDERV